MEFADVDGPYRRSYVGSSAYFLSIDLVGGSLSNWPK